MGENDSVSSGPLRFVESVDGHWNLQHVVRYATVPMFGEHGADLAVSSAIIWAVLMYVVTSALQGTADSEQLSMTTVAAGIAFSSSLMECNDGNPQAMRE